MRLETKAVASALGSQWRGDGALICHGLSEPVEIHTIGIRASRLARVPASPDIAGVILAGLGGGLDPSLKVGELVVDCFEFRKPMHLDSFRAGKIHTASDLVCTPAEKQALHRAHGALAVEMEGDAVKRWASSLNVPFLHVRGISDAADGFVDRGMLGMIDDVGRVRPLVLAKVLLTRPRLIPRLKKLGVDSQLAADKVAGWLRMLLSNPRSSFLDGWLNHWTRS